MKYFLFVKVLWKEKKKIDAPLFGGILYKINPPPFGVRERGGSSSSTV
jgi:hypothetical protein